MDKKLPTIITIGLIAILIAPSPGYIHVVRAEDCGVLEVTSSSSPNPDCYELLEHCLNENSGFLDLDGDHLANDVEVCFLGTDPLDADSDGDDINDGYDATPGADEVQPLKIGVAKYKQNYPDPVCDDGSRWDLYFSAINFQLPNVGIDTDFDYDGWTVASHGHDHGYGDPFNWLSINDDVTNVNGGSASGSFVEVELDPDLTSWSGFNELNLRLDGFLTLADHDAIHYPDGYDDFMDLDIDAEDILKIDIREWEFETTRAYDQDDQNMKCQAGIKIETMLVDLDANVLSSADALMDGLGGTVNCSHPLVYGCDIGAARQAWS